VDFDRKYPYDSVLDWLPASVAPLGAEYQREMREALSGEWIDVYENQGKRSGAYSAPVYGVHPYMLLNYNDTLDAVFTLAHEMGIRCTRCCRMRTTVRVCELHDFRGRGAVDPERGAVSRLHARGATDERERIVLLQHAIDGIVSTFYTQVLFADYELQAHRLVEEGRPVTADDLGEIYFNLLKTYHGDAFDYDELSRVTWARIRISSARRTTSISTRLLCIQREVDEAADERVGIGSGSGDRGLPHSPEIGGNDHPMTLLQKAGVDLSKRETVCAVVDQLDALVTRLEREISAL